jgi:hypothetical protein
MPQYLLPLHGDPANWRKRTPEEQQKTHRYLAWSQIPFKRDSKVLAPGGIEVRQVFGS